MRTIDVIRRSGVGIAPDQTIRQAATIMEQSGVGALAVVDGNQLVGIITDRDLVRRAMAEGLPDDARVDSIMSSPVVTISAGIDVHEAFSRFRTHGVRRLVVVRDGQFVGMLTIDDLMIDLANDLADLARPVVAEVRQPHHDSALPATR